MMSIKKKTMSQGLENCCESMICFPCSKREAVSYRQLLYVVHKFIGEIRKREIQTAPSSVSRAESHIWANHEQNRCVVKVKNPD